MSKSVGVLGTIAFLSASSALAGSTEARFEIDQPFHISGRGYDAGVIAVHELFPFTPKTAILEVWVNDECLGMMQAHRSDPAGTAALTEAFFTRDSQGRLLLTGFRVRARAR